MSLFDAYVIVDWSANARPKTGKDSIWIGSATRHPGVAVQVRTENLCTRAEAQARIEGLLDEHRSAKRRVLLGFDFPYGYPAGFAVAVKNCDTGVPPWQATWSLLSREVHDEPRNANNRFAVAAGLNAACGLAAGPFWGCPSSRTHNYLRTNRHGWNGAGLRRYRHTERRLRGNGSLVQEVWKLWTAGSVGSQALLGIPRVARLRHHPRFESFSVVWPFETGFTCYPIEDKRPAVLHAEIWPGIAEIANLNGRVRDDVQVETLALHFATLDDKSGLRTLFGRPEELDDQAVDECVTEEGWILGA